MDKIEELAKDLAERFAGKFSAGTFESAAKECWHASSREDGKVKIFGIDIAGKQDLLEHAAAFAKVENDIWIKAGGGEQVGAKSIYDAAIKALKL
jgi:hypothetical protein